MLTSVDLLGQIIRTIPDFRGKGRLINYWIAKTTLDKRIRKLPGGARILCDISVPYEAMVWLRREEQGDLKLLRRLLKPHQTFVDCGANIGLWSLVAAAVVGASGRVYAFEPNPFTFEKLADNSSPFDHIKLFNSAVGDVNEECPFVCNQFHNLSQVVQEEDSATIKVPVITLDSLLGDGPVSGIKLDVEGYEQKALKGGEAILKRYKPWLCVEFNTMLAQVNRLDDWPVYHYLRELGYTCRLFKDALDSSPETILPGYWQTTGYCNLYFCPG